MFQRAHAGLRACHLRNGKYIAERPEWGAFSMQVGGLKKNAPVPEAPVEQAKPEPETQHIKKLKNKRQIRKQPKVAELVSAAAPENTLGEPKIKQLQKPKNPKKPSNSKPADLFKRSSGVTR